MYFFIRYFVLDFGFKQFNPITATLISGIGLYLLIRINLLLMLCVTTNAGSIKYVKTHRKGLDRARLKYIKMVKLCEMD